MKRALATAAVLALGLAAGFLVGQRSRPPGASTPPATGTPAAKRILYYRNPMGLADTSPTPKKDPMGMDYVPVYQGEEADDTNPNAIRISSEKLQKMGVRIEPVQEHELSRTVRALGRVELDERRISAVAPKFEGWIERLEVGATGQPVAKGQALFEVYSPELVSAQREYAIAAESAQTLKNGEAQAQQGMSALAAASLARLRNQDVPEEHIRELAKHGKASRTLSFRSPVAGIVIEKKALLGMRFAPGDTLYQIADLSSVWVVADVFERDLAGLEVGQSARISVDAYPGKTFAGKIGYVYPTLKAETRTVPVRIELANPGGLLKPGLFASVELAAGRRDKVLSVPASAVIDGGQSQRVLVARGGGRFEARKVELGRRSDDYVEVLSGVSRGEAVVVSANFLIDAESNLKAAVGALAQAPASQPAAARPAASHQAEGRIEAVDLSAGALSINHGPIASLKWPAMTMDFKLADPALARGLKPGTGVRFEINERKPGEWVITRIDVAPTTHEGH